MNIKGIQKMTLLDYPGKVACTIFTKGCNFRCPFCHNASLVGNEAECLEDEDVLAFLKKRVGILDGVCISGGEPTLNKDLPEFIDKVKTMGYLVKLDTNGSNPTVMKDLYQNGLIDYVAMDIKNSLKKYNKTAGVSDFDLSGIAESAEWLMNGHMQYEFRTTVVDELHEPEDFHDIGKWLTGAEKYFLQWFADSGDIIQAGLHRCSDEKMANILNVIKKYIPYASVRGE